MSIEKDVEKMYRGDVEKQKKKQKKKKKNRFILILFLIIIIVVILLLMNYLGLGFGGGKGSGGDNSGDNSVSSVAEESSSVAETTTETVPEEYVDIKVSGNTYIFDGKEIMVDELVEKISQYKDNFVVRIYDDNATQNAMDTLTKALQDEGRNYYVGMDNDDSTSSSESSDLDSAAVTTVVP